VTKLDGYGGKKLNVYNVSCGVDDEYADTCGLVLFGSRGDTRKTMIERWNKREPQ